MHSSPSREKHKTLNCIIHKPPSILLDLIQMAGSSNPLPDASIQDLRYLYASIANVSNFVSVKLSGNHNYPLWKRQMLCLMDSHDMRGIVDADSAFGCPRTSSIMKKYDSLLTGWILGSITEDVFVNVFNLDSAKDVWEKLNSIYHNPTISFQQDSAQTYPEAKEETNDKDVVSEETKGEISTKAKKEERERMEGKKKMGKDILEKHKDAGREERNSEASTPAQDHHYIHASNANISNFVSVKLSSDRNYHLWRRQMRCLLKTYDVYGFVDRKFDRPIASTDKLEKQYNKLVKGWIFCSVSEGVLGTVIDIKSAEKVWDKLKSFYDPTISSQPAGKEEQEEIELKKNLCKATMKGSWSELKTILEQNKGAEKKAINSDGNTILHLAVGIGENYIVDLLLRFIKDKAEKAEKGEKGKNGEEGEKGKKGDKEGKGEKEVKEVLELKNVDGNTALHIAAIVGNLAAARVLVEKHKGLLKKENKQREIPLLIACSHMQADTFMYLYKTDNDADGKTKQAILDVGNSELSVDNTEIGTEELVSSKNTKIGVNLLVNAISAKQYSTASELVKNFPEFAVESEDVLMAIAKTFPSGLTKGEKLIYPSSLVDMRERIIERTRLLFLPLETLWFECRTFDSDEIVLSVIIMMLLVPVVMFALVYQLIRFLILMIYLPFFLPYLLSWKVATILVAPIKHIEVKQNEREKAKEVLNLVFEKIDDPEAWKCGTHHFSYNRSILEAACQNASRVVKEILSRSPEAITSTDKSKHDIIQLAIIHRSEKVYNLIYEIGERKIGYKTLQDCSGNNILHLASRLAPSHKLNRKTGAALQLQRELQWREEVKKHVYPTYITKENFFKETPDMVFTREHENLVKEGEAWMKTTAESCSITAALITTIVFAAAITVPGGSNEGTGIPVFTKDIAFTIFAISDAISLFTSSASLLVFLSILTARFAEQDFLVSLPRRLIIGLCTLLLSATAMMVAFSATLFLVFCRQKPWMLAPICGLACLPIAFFFAVQFPLILDLFRSTYGRTFGKQSDSQPGSFNIDDVRGFFGK